MWSRLKEVIEGGEPEVTNFLNLIIDLYYFPCFTDLINFIISCTYTKKIKIQLNISNWPTMQEGLCQTIHKPWYDKLLGKFIFTRSYLLEIKKLKKNVVIHEMSHALEKEIPVTLVDKFFISIKEDLKKIPLITLKKQIQTLMVEEIALYPEREKLAELFARYFELFTFTQEVTKQTGFYLNDLQKFFVNTEGWRNNILIPYLSKHILPEVKKYSLELTKQTNKLLNIPNKKPPLKWQDRNPSIFKKS